MKKLVILLSTIFLLSACSPTGPQEASVEGVEFDAETVTVNYSDDKDEQIFKVEEKPDGEWPADIIGATLSGSKRFVAIEQSYPEGIGVTIHDLSDGSNHDALGHQGSLEWDGDILVLKSRKEGEEGFYYNKSTSEQKPWELEPVPE